MGQVLQWTGSAWQNTALVVTFSEISDITLTSPHSVGDVLTWNGSTWQNEQPATPATPALSTLSDVDVTEGSGINGYTLNWNNGVGKWQAVAPISARFATSTALGNTGTVSLNPALGDVFTTSPTAAMTINAASAPVGAHVVIEITTAGDSTSHLLTLGTNFYSHGNIQVPATSGTIEWTIEFIGDGTNLVEVARTCAPAPAVLGTTGTVNVNPYQGDTLTITPTGAVTLNALWSAVDKIIKIIVTTSGASSFNITFGSNFKSQGILATGTASGKVFVVTFVGDGTNFNEMCRTTAM